MNDLIQIIEVLTPEQVKFVNSELDKKEFQVCMIGFADDDGGSSDGGSSDGGSFDGGSFDGGSFDGGSFDGGGFDGFDLFS